MKDYLQKEFDSDEILACPICGDNYTHLEKVEEYTDDGRKCVKLHFYCESGHTFGFDFNQHEGITFIKDSAIEPVKKFYTVICVKSGIYNDTEFYLGDVYPISGDNNGQHLIYTDKNGDAKVMLLFNYNDGTLQEPSENPDYPVFRGYYE